MLAGIAAAGVIVNVLMLTAPIFMLQVYDRVLASRSLATLAGLCVIALFLFIIQAVVDALRGRLLVRLSVILDESLRDRVFDAVQAEGLKKSDRDGLQLMRDLDTLRAFVSGSGLIAAFDLPWTPFYLLVCFLFHPLIGAAVGGGVLALCAVTLLSELSTRRTTRTIVPLTSQRRMTAETGYRHAEAVRAMGMHARLRELWSARTAELIDAQSLLADRSGGFGSLSRFVRMVLQSGVLALGAWLVIQQQGTAGVMLAATILAIRTLGPIELAIANWRAFLAARDAFDRLRFAMNATVAKSDVTALPRPSKSLRVNSVSVAVPDSGAVVLHEISFALTAGSVLAVIGPSGSGKSTLARVLVGAWPAARGVIRIDGAAQAQWDTDALGSSIGFLPQDIELFSGTVAMNISRFSATLESVKLIDAAMAADVHEMILRLPQGYETEVGEGGLMLSGGQRQRVGLARALYGDPFIVVLDEPNSNLDAEGERALARALDAVRARGGIVIVISHRPAVLGVADHVLVLNEGRMQAFGRTEEVVPRLRPQPAAKPAAATPKVAGSGA